MKSGGYRAEGFESGVEFFNALKNNLPDMILLDVMLPSENGFVITSYSIHYTKLYDSDCYESWE